jgi:hypothetical protein
VRMWRVAGFPSPLRAASRSSACST